MNKKIKSVVSCAAALALSMSAFSAALPVSAAIDLGKYVPVSASSSSEVKGPSELEAALRLVKERVDIPESYSDFTYSTNTYTAKDTYVFEWKEDPETGSYGKSTITVEVSGGMITSYSKYDPDYEEYSSRPSFTELSDEQLEAAAKKAAAMFDPEITDKIRIDKSEIDRSLTSKTVTVYFDRIVNGVEFSQNYGSVSIDKNTGEIIRFYLTWWNDAKFKSTDAAAPMDKIEAAYKRNAELVPSYRISSGSDGSNSAVIVYAPEEDVVLDAELAKPTTMYDDYQKAQNTDYYDWSSGYGMGGDFGYAEETADAKAAAPQTNAGNGEIAFSEAEKAALIESGKYYSKSDIVKILREDKYLRITDKYVLDYADFRKTYDYENYNCSGYIWDMSFCINNSDVYKSISVTADAETGKIISFWKYNSKDPQETIDVEKVNKTAEAAAKHFLPDVYGEFVPEKSNTAKAKKETSRDIIFSRTHEGIKVDGNYIDINVNSAGEVMGFSYSYDKAEFDSPEIISADEAFSELFAQREFILSYDGFLDLEGTPHTYLLYSLDSYNLNAKTGKLCDYYGNEISEDAEDSGCPYTDISGTKYEKYIKKLYDYGITLSDSDTEFRPDKGITEREFAELLDKVNYSGIVYELYGDSAYNGSSKAGKKVLTKAASAKMFVISAGGKDFAKYRSIYKSPFNDVSESDKNIGYIAMAYAIGAARPDKNGNFNPEEKVSRGYAMYLICGYIESANR